MSRFPLADKRHYENQLVIDHTGYVDCKEFDDKSLSHLIAVLTELQYELVSKNPDKTILVNFVNDDDFEMMMEYNICHIETDEERDARVAKIELDALAMMEKFKKLLDSKDEN